MFNKLLTSTINSLTNFLNDALIKMMEPIRVARVGASLIFAGNNPSNIRFKKVADYLLKMQSSDGGWSDPEEAAWAINFISKVYGKDNKAVKSGIDWIKKVRFARGGWGRHPRDKARIITTALVMTLVPSVGTNSDREWVRQEWENDLSSPVQLSYKGGFYLLTSIGGERKTPSFLVPRTIKYLVADQNVDGGFAPWLGHPIGSDPWSTGVVLWGLSSWADSVDPNIIKKSLNWLMTTQLLSGYWPYHYLDEGTAYALIGLSNAVKSFYLKD